MSTPSKILQFRRPDHPVAPHLVPGEPETFPRFREEWNRPAPLPAPHHLGPAAAPPPPRADRS